MEHQPIKPDRPRNVSCRLDENFRPPIRRQLEIVDRLDRSEPVDQFRRDQREVMQHALVQRVSLRFLRNFFEFWIRLVDQFLKKDDFLKNDFLKNHDFLFYYYYYFKN